MCPGLRRFELSHSGCGTSSCGPKPEGSREQILPFLPSAQKSIFLHSTPLRPPTLYPATMAEVSIEAPKLNEQPQTVTVVRTEPVLTPEQETLRAKKERELYYWNIAMTVLHGLQAVIALGMGLAITRLKNFRTPLITTFPAWTRGYPEPALQVVGSLPFVPVTSGFAFLSAIFHAFTLIWYKQYIADLRKGINKFRWIEYGFSSSLMIGLIAQLFGVYDVMTLVTIMSVNACMNYFGYMMELQNQTTDYVDWTAFWFGCFAGIVPWAVIVAQAAGTPGISAAPAFVWAILAVYFIFFNTFPINMILQYRRQGRFADNLFPGSGYYLGEKIYQILSLVAKSLLLWLVIGGSNQPSAANPQPL
ncbi:membrane protein [Hyaloraphidium curvatum]|nr:membrane protein [Hyaloraphidium curvatum]